MQWLTLEGNYYEIGYQLGYWWAQELKRLEGREYGRRFLSRCREGSYRNELANGWNKVYLPLFKNVARDFPEIIEEIAGMSQGAKVGGLETSLLDMFSLVLGETEYNRLSCSSFVVRKGSEVILGHNEEEMDVVYPLCFAAVNLKVNGRVIKFVSVSYPFQLFGSSTGMNKSIAFQGNSIGCKDQQLKLQSTWKGRVPKTVFSRKLLELTNMNEVRQLFGRYHCTLPSHHYVLNNGNAHSVEIRPKLSIKAETAKQQLITRRHSRRIHVHTNHFHKNGVSEGIWRWGVDCKDSLNRFVMLEKLLKDNDVSTTERCMAVLHCMQNGFPESTSASIAIEQSSNRSTLSGLYYFHQGKPIQIKPISL